jgi:hypothetical protein
MSRRPPSLHRVAIEDDCPDFNGTTRTLRLPAIPPAAASFPSPQRYHGCVGCFAPDWLADAASGPGCCFRAAIRRAACCLRGDDWVSQVPAQSPLPSRSCSFDPGETGWNSPCRSNPAWPRFGERPWLSRWTFEAQSHGLMARCLRFAVPGRPGPTQDSLPIARLRSIGWVSHPQGLH